MPPATTGYRSLLRTPGAAAFFLTAAVGRVGIAMTGLGLVWPLHARTSSYTGAALATQHQTAPKPERASLRSERSPLLQPTFLLLALLNVAIGLYFGTMGVSVSAFATSHNIPSAAAPIIAAASLSGLLSGWYYGLRRRSTPARRQLVIATTYLTAASALLPLAPSAIWLGVAVVAAEAAVPPILVLLNVLTEKSIRPSVLTQAFTWNNSASAAGSALAASFAGHAADTWGASAALAQAPLAGLVLVALSLALYSRKSQQMQGF